MPPRPKPIYQVTINNIGEWAQLSSKGLDVVVDPLVFRLGQLFLEGKQGGPDRWPAIESDIGAVVAFFDLLVLHDQLPAFNYPDTFYTTDTDYSRDEQDLTTTWEARDGLGKVLNTRGDQTLVHVDIEHIMYREAKAAAIHQLAMRLHEGPIASEAATVEILKMLDAVKYGWEPRLEELDPLVPNVEDKRLVRFLLGQLVFAGYAQQTGAPHVLAPKRSLVLASIGLRTDLPTAGDAMTTFEGKVFDELGRRCRDAGAGWRNYELPWTPSFLPFLLQRIKDPYKEGPDVLLQAAKDLRDSRAVKRYRDLRRALSSQDASTSRSAQKDLQTAADKVADELRSPREDLEYSRHVVVEVLPKAIGAAALAGGGFVVAGLPGAVAGAVVGVVGEDVLRQVNKNLWGWFVNDLPFHSARKLLSRSVKAEYELKDKLGPELKKVWETGPTLS